PFGTVELFEPWNPTTDNTKDSLLGVINKTRTGMGARLLRNWLVRPSIAPAEISSRLEAVGELVSSLVLLEETRSSFEGVFDLERLLSKITVGTASPRELIELRASIRRSPGVASAHANLQSASYL